MPTLNQDSSYAGTLKIASFFFLCCIVLLACITTTWRLLGIGADYDGYIELFVKGRYTRDSVEPAYLFLRYVNDHVFGGQVGIVYFVSALLALSLKIHAFKFLSKNYGIILCFYFISFFVIHEYTQIRAAVAIGVFLCSIKDLVNNRSRNYFIKMLLAMLFHYSSIVMLFCWIYVRMSISKKTYILITLCAFLFSLFMAEFAASLTEYIYLLQTFVGLNKSGGESDFMSPWNLKYVTLLALFFYLSFIIKKTDSINWVLYKIFSFGLCCYYYLLPVGLPVITVRLAEFYTVVFIVLLVNVSCSKAYLSKFGRGCLFVSSIIVSLLYGYATLKTTFII